MIVRHRWAEWEDFLEKRENFSFTDEEFCRFIGNTINELKEMAEHLAYCKQCKEAWLRLHQGRSKR